MESKDNINNTKVQFKSKDSNNKFRDLKSDYFIQILFHIISKNKSLELIKYNKYIQKRINININDYKDYVEIYSPIEIEVIPKIKKYENDEFININKYTIFIISWLYFYFNFRIFFIIINIYI